MKTVTLATLRAAAREAADMVGSDFISVSELDRLINTYKDELWDLIVAAYESQKTASYTFNTVGGTVQYTLPVVGAPTGGADFYKLLGVDVTLGADQVITCEPFNFHNRNRYSYIGWERGRPVAYRLMGNQIWLNPAPDAAYPVTVWYIPILADLVSPIDTLDGVNGWERYIVVSCAIAMLQKEKSDPSILMAEKASLTDRIKSMRHNRDAGEPDQVVDVRGRRWSQGLGRFG